MRKATPYGEKLAEISGLTEAVLQALSQKMNAFEQVNFDGRQHKYIHLNPKCSQLLTKALFDL